MTKIIHVVHDFNNFLIIEANGEKLEIFVEPLGDPPKFTGWDFKFKIKSQGQEIEPKPCCGPGAE